MTYYFLYSQKPVFQYVGIPQITTIVFTTLVLTFILQLLRYYKKTHPEITGTEAIDNE